MTVLALLIAATAAAAGPTAACTVRSDVTVRPLVELYTSEGCSSCPPADRWLSRRAPQGEATWLAFHVDYWDGLGWRDRFASPRHTRRQRERAQALESDTIYTPQVMVGPELQARWRDDDDFDALLQAQRRDAPVGVSIAVRGEGRSRQAVVATALDAARAPAGQRVWLARYSDAESTAVPAGENRGSRLRHDRVVRALWGPWLLVAGVATHTVPVRVAAPSGGLVAFVQDARGDTWQSLDLPFAQCQAVAARP